MKQCTFVVLACLVASACAQAPAEPSGIEPATDQRNTPSLPRAVEERLPTVAQVAKHADAMQLSAQTRQAITTDIAQTQAKLLEVEQRLTERTQTLAAALDRVPLELDYTTSLGSEVIAAEAELKQLHLSLLLRMRNRLTPQQLTTLGITQK